MHIYTDMVGDLFHPGHVELLRRARAMGSRLTVGVCGDDLVKSYKRVPVMTLSERAAVISACCHVDEIVPDCPCPVTAEFIRSRKIDLIVRGDDLSEDGRQYWYSVPIAMGIYREIPYSDGLSTTIIIDRILQRQRPDD